MQRMPFGGGFFKDGLAETRMGGREGGNAAHQVEALGEDGVVLAGLALEFKGAAIEAGQDWVSLAAGVAIAVAVPVAGTDVADTVVVAVVGPGVVPSVAVAVVGAQVAAAVAVAVQVTDVIEAVAVAVLVAAVVGTIAIAIV